MKTFIKDVCRSWVETYKSNKLLFFVELFSTMLAMTACALINITPDEVNMFIVIPCYGISAFGMAWASIKRRSSFMALLMIYYFLFSVFGFIRLII